MLSGALDVELPVELTANALPLAFERDAGSWRAVPLMEPVAVVQAVGVA